MSKLKLPHNIKGSTGSKLYLQPQPQVQLRQLDVLPFLAYVLSSSTLRCGRMQLRETPKEGVFQNIPVLLRSLCLGPERILDLGFAPDLHPLPDHILPYSQSSMSDRRLSVYESGHAAFFAHWCSHCIVHGTTFTARKIGIITPKLCRYRVGEERGK